jgi:hypothetical protein
VFLHTSLYFRWPEVQEYPTFAAPGPSCNCLSWSSHCKCTKLRVWSVILHIWMVSNVKFPLFLLGRDNWWYWVSCYSMWWNLVSFHLKNTCSVPFDFFHAYTGRCRIYYNFKWQYLFVVSICTKIWFNFKCVQSPSCLFYFRMDSRFDGFKLFLRSMW